MEPVVESIRLQASCVLRVHKVLRSRLLSSLLLGRLPVTCYGTPIHVSITVSIMRILYSEVKVDVEYQQHVSRCSRVGGDSDTPAMSIGAIANEVSCFAGTAVAVRRNRSRGGVGLS